MTNNRKKLLIIYGDLLHYRKPLFNQIAKRYDLTVAHTGKSTVTQHDIYKEKLVSFRKIGPFYLQSGIIKESQCDYDYIVVFADVRWLSRIYVILRRNPRAKFILWGAWITKNPLANWVRVYLTKRADSNIFYTYEAKSDFLDYGIDQNKLFVANNTIDVGGRVKSFEHPIKDIVLFVGSLDKRKQSDVLIKAFSSICNKICPNIKIEIIGDGECKEELRALTNKLDISHRVNFVGRIDDSDLLKSYYKRAIVSVSFGQAGLSVLQSFGFGVPFLTKLNAISGGEKSNINSGVNSIFCQDDIRSLEENMIKICNDLDFARLLGKNAFAHYSTYCTIENMAQGFFDAIENTRVANVDTSRHPL